MSYVEPSICIPRVFANIGWKRIKSTIEEAGWGTVAHVDMVMKTGADGQEYKRVFVHFSEWKNVDVQTDLMADKEVILTYNDPWFWKITKSRSSSSSGNSSGSAPPKRSDYTKRPSAGAGTEASSVAALEQTVRMQAQQLQLLTSLMLQQQGLSGATMGATMMPMGTAVTPTVTPVKSSYAPAPAAPKKHMKALGDGHYKEKRNYRTPPKRLDMDTTSASVSPVDTTSAVETTSAATATETPTAPAPAAPKKLLLRRKLEDADTDTHEE